VAPASRAGGLGAGGCGDFSLVLLKVVISPQNYSLKITPT